LNRHHVQNFIDRVISYAPMPPEAYPPGAVGKFQGVKAMAELAWKDMAITMFALGTIFGMVVLLTIVLAIVLKSFIPTIIKVIANAHP
jgi:hypothetical protein